MSWFATEILNKDLNNCQRCGRLRGYVEEKYNGWVPVLCQCDLKNPDTKIGGHFPSPSLVSRADGQLLWTPTTDHKHEDGEWWHMPYFMYSLT